MSIENIEGAIARRAAETGMGALAAALAKAQGLIKGASKDRTNPHFGSKYADLASVWEACRAALSANGLAVVQTTTTDAEGSVSLRTLLLHAGGASIEGLYPIRPQQPTPQGYGSAITYARRYALAAMVGVAPDDDDDGNAASSGPQSPPASDFVRRLGDAQSLAEVQAIRSEVALHIHAYPPATQGTLSKARDAAIARLTPKPEPIAEAPEQAAQRAALREALTDEPPSDDQQALALTERLAKATTLAEYDALWAVIQTSPEWRAATEGARGIAALNVAALRPAIAEQPKKGGRK